MKLYLVGPRGSGKSTVAKIVAHRLDQPLISTDEWIESESGKTIAEVFSQDGEVRFRDWESAALAMAAQSPGTAVVDLGGGAVLRESNRRLIRQTGRTVWLFAKVEILWSRVVSDPRTLATRPPLTTQDGLSEIRQIVEERDSIYAACADYEIDTGALSADEVARRVVAWFGSVDKCKSKPPP